MSFNDANRSQIRSFKNQGSPKTSNFGEDDDDDLMSFSREERRNKMMSLILPDSRPEFDRLLQKYVKELISKKNTATTTIVKKSSNSEIRSLELRISNVISTLLTNDPIKDIEGMPVEITLVDSRTREKVKSGVEASGKVEIVVIKAEVDDGRNEFEGKLVHHMEGNKSVRGDRLCLNLIEGTAVLPTVSFVRNNRWLKISKIRLQARFVDDISNVQVKEAQTEPFCVKDRRNEAYKKHDIPSLHDDVWRLNKVDRKGTLFRSLIEAKIKTVEDFIVRLFLHPGYLEKIFDGAKHAKSFELTVKHARKCPAKLTYWNSSSDQKTAVAFNVSGEVLELYLEGQLLSGVTLSETQKEVAKKLVISAFKNWGNVNKDQLVAYCSPHLRNNGISLDGDDLDINENCLFSNMFTDEQDPNPQFLPEPLRARYKEIYHWFESVCTSNEHQQEPFTKAAQKARFCKRWRKLIFVVMFMPKRSLGEIRAHKKPRSFS